MRTLDHSNPFPNVYEVDNYEYNQYNQSYKNILFPKVKRDAHETIYIELPEAQNAVG